MKVGGVGKKGLRRWWHKIQFYVTHTITYVWNCERIYTLLKKTRAETRSASVRMQQSQHYMFTYEHTLKSLLLLAGLYYWVRTVKTMQVSGHSIAEKKPRGLMCEFTVHCTLKTNWIVTIWLGGSKPPTSTCVDPSSVPTTHMVERGDSWMWRSDLHACVSHLKKKKKW